MKGLKWVVAGIVLAIAYFVDPSVMAGLPIVFLVTSNTSESNNDPWEYQQYQLAPYLNTAGYYSQYYGDDSTAPYSGDRVSDMNRYQTGALDQIYSTGMGTDYSNTSSDEMNKIASGYYTSTENNPLIEMTYNQMLEDTLPSIMSGASAAGRYGSNTHSEMLNDALAEASYAAIGPERGYQVSAAEAAPEYTASELANQATAYGAGAQYQEQAQSELDANMDLYDETQNQYWDYLDKWLGSITY